MEDVDLTVRAWSGSGRARATRTRWSRSARWPRTPSATTSAPGTATVTRPSWSPWGSARIGPQGLPYSVDTAVRPPRWDRRPTVANIVDRRAPMAGVTNADGSTVHAHQLRHTFAHTLLAAAAGGGRHDPGRVEARKMMDRYGADLREDRAAAAYRDPLARRRR